MLKSTIVISGKEFTLKESNRVIFKYEEISGKSAFVGAKSQTDYFQLFYANITVNNPDYTKSFDEFMAEIDQDENCYCFPSFLLYKEQAQEDLERWQKTNDPNYESKKKAAQQMAAIMSLGLPTATK